MNDNSLALMTAVIPLLGVVTSILGVVFLFMRRVTDMHFKTMEDTAAAKKLSDERAAKLEASVKALEANVEDVAEQKTLSDAKAERLQKDVEALKASHDDTLRLLTEARRAREEEQRLRLKAEQERDAEHEKNERLKVQLDNIEGSVAKLQGELESIKLDRQERQQQHEAELTLERQKAASEREARLIAERQRDDALSTISMLQTRVTDVERQLNEIKAASDTEGSSPKLPVMQASAEDKPNGA